MPKHRALPPLAELQEVFEYNSATGAFKWKKTLSSRAIKGTTAGAAKDGYVVIRYKNVLYRAHRLAYYFHTGVDPAEMTIDHKDGNRNNNSVSNLRLATHKDQQGNRPNPVNNTSGSVGVCFDKAKNKWMARLGKKFIGYFTAKEEAAAAYEEAATAYFGEFRREAT